MSGIRIAPGIIIGGAVVYAAVDHHTTRYQSIANREYKAGIAMLSTRALARIRTGDIDAAARLLEDHLDSFLAGVPMGEDYPQMTKRCQRSLAVAKIYRSRCPFPGGCRLHGHALHAEHLPVMLERVPMLPEKRHWLDDAVQKIRILPPAGKTT